MNKIFSKIPHFIIFSILFMNLNAQVSKQDPDIEKILKQNKNYQYLVLAGGCFWCIESDFEKKEGVIEAISGYSSQKIDDSVPTYETVSNGGTGFREVVLVIYDSSKINFRELIDFFWQKIDPIDAAGQFCDKGFQYTSAIYYMNDEEKQMIIDSQSIILKKPLFQDNSIATKIEPLINFYKAENYHQNYYKQNPIRYYFYRTSCGRDKHLKKIWYGQKN